MQSEFYAALTSNSDYANLVPETFREFAGDDPQGDYAVYYEVSDNRDQSLEGPRSTGGTRIQLDVFTANATTSKSACEAAIKAIQDSDISLISSSSRSKRYDLETRRYGHSVDLFIHY